VTSISSVPPCSCDSMFSHSSSIEQDRRVHPAGPSLFLVCRLHHRPEACTSMSTIPPVKALYCTCNVREVSRKPFQGSLKPTRPKESCMRCAVSCSAGLARKLRSLANELPAIKPSSHHPAQKPQQRRATSIAVIPKKCTSVLPRRLLEHSPAGGYPSAHHCSWTSMASLRIANRTNIGVPLTTSLHTRGLDRHMLMLPDLTSTTTAKIWHNTPMPNGCKSQL
jgi:hypothetical protein